MATAADLLAEKERQSARATIDKLLADLGLDALSEWAWNLIKEGRPMDLIFLEMRARPEYEARFPAMRALAEKGRALSEAAYIGYEQQAVAVMRAAGLPEGFYDQPDDFARFLENEVSVAELQSRVDMYQQAAFQAPVEVLQELESTYGIGPGEITAYFIDEQKALPLIQKQWVAAQTSGAARITGYGPLSQTESERLAGLGVDPGQAQEIFSGLAGQAQLFQSLDRGEQAISRETQLAAGFEGEAGAIAEIDKRARRRVSAFEGGGGVAGSERGFVGAGSAKT